jgi:hypothetical protein
MREMIITPEVSGLVNKKLFDEILADAQWHGLQDVLAAGDLIPEEMAANSYNRFMTGKKAEITDDTLPHKIRQGRKQIILRRLSEYENHHSELESKGKLALKEWRLNRIASGPATGDGVSQMAVVLNTIAAMSMEDQAQIYGVLKYRLFGS